MSSVETVALRKVRQFTKAGISDCKDALLRNDGDTYLAIRDLLSNDQILEMHCSLRIRLMAKGSIKDPPTREEIKIVERLHAEIVPRLPWWKRALSGLIGVREKSSLPEEWTDDMTFPLPEGVTEKQIVAIVIEAGVVQTPDDITETKLIESLGLLPEDAALARDRVFGGIVRAATNNSANCPHRYKDPLAWHSFQRVIRDPSIVAKIYPELVGR